MTQESSVVDISGAAIICSHVALDDHPILRAARDEPVQAEDSGWQFMCGLADHDDEDAAQVWSISHVLREEPSLKGRLNEPPGTIWLRRSASAEWKRQ